MENKTIKASVSSNYIRVSPYKLRKIANVVRSKNVHYALGVLSNMPHKSAKILYNILKSAIANGVNNHKMDKDVGMVISTLMVNEAPVLKRYQPRARGRMYQILKRSSHVCMDIEQSVGELNGK